MGAGITRRAFVAALPFLGRAAEIYRSESKRLRDPATEFEITRLTDPSFNSWLIPPPGRSIVGRNNALLYCSDRDGAVQAYRLDLKSGESRRLTSATKLDRATVAYLPDEHTVCFFEENTLFAASGTRQRTVYEVESGWERTPAFTITDDGNHALLVERKGNKRRLQMITIGRGAAGTVVEADEDINFVRPRPKRASILYGRDNSLWLVDYTGQNNRRLKTPAGTPAQALWSADGKSFTYLRIPESETELNDLREHVPDTNEDKKIASTSQFVTFSRNSDASVFAGVSRNKASPYILILLRVAHRELTVAEHRARNPQDVTVLFTPNSQRLLWDTDREGKFAIYSLAVERFVENTETSEASYIPGDTFLLHPRCGRDACRLLG
jgi:oligogalacturonide lyase